MDLQVHDDPSTRHTGGVVVHSSQAALAISNQLAEDAVGCFIRIHRIGQLQIAVRMIYFHNGPIWIYYKC